MVGKFEGRGLLALAVLWLAVSVAGAVSAEVVKGRSRELGIQFEVLGGADWCRSEVSVVLAAATPGAFQPETLSFTQMIGRIRAVVLDQCPSVERLVFVGSAQKRPVVGIEMSRLTRWRRLFVVDPATRMPLCPPQGAGSPDCRKRAEAYLMAHRLMRGEQFADTELTTVLEEGEGAQAVWTSGEVTGKLTIRNRSDFAGRFASNGQLADAVIDALSGVCSRESGQPDRAWSETWAGSADPAISVRGFSCRPPTDAPTHHAVIVSTAGQQFHVFALLSAGDNPGAARTAASPLVQTIAGVR